MKRHERSSGGVFRPPESEARGHLAAWKPRTCCWDARLWRSRPGLVPLRGPGAWPRAVTAKASAPGRCAHAGRSAEQPGPVRPAPARRAARRPLRARTTAPRPALPRRPAVPPSLHVPSCPFMCLYTSSRVPPLSLSPRPPLLPPLSLDARRTVHVRVRVRVPSFVQRTRTALRMCPFPHGEVPVIGDTVCSSSSPGGGPGTTPGCRAGPRTLSARSLDETCAACARAHLCVAYIALAC